MTIPTEFQGYGNEEAFKLQFVIPMLQRLGFSMVSDIHGKRELGRDVIFGEIDRFGHVCYHGLQVKYEASIGVNAIEGLITDAFQALGNPFKHPHTGAEERISRFYAVNAGNVTDEGRDNFFNRLAGNRGNVRLIYGPALLTLNQWGTMNRGVFQHEELAGILREIRYNRRIASVLMTHLTSQSYLVERCRLAAFSGFLHRPIMMPQLEIELFENYWQRVSTLNKLADEVNAVVVAGTNQSRRDMIPGLVREIEAVPNQIETRVETVLDKLNPLSPFRR